VPGAWLQLSGDTDAFVTTLFRDSKTQQNCAQRTLLPRAPMYDSKGHT
jgi:hypothetical protein